MTKKLAITYTFLFLFVFTFALSFTFASKAQAEGGGCWVISMCPPPYDYLIQEQGHFVKTVGCINPGGNPCDWTYQCGPESRD
jgi:hypothetical protein